MSRTCQLPLLLVAALAVACSGASKSAPSTPGGAAGSGATQFPAAGPPFVVPGERMTYRVTAHDMTLAAFAIEIGNPTSFHDRPAIVVQAGAESTGVAALVKPVKAEFATWIDTKNGEPLLFRVTETAGRGDETIESNEARFTEIAEGKFPIATRRPDGTEIVEAQNLVRPEKPIDTMTFLMGVRGWDGPIGEQHTIDVVRSRYLWRTEVRLAARTSVVTDLGQLPAVKFDATASRIMRDGSLDKGTDPRHFSVWVSDDADRVPLLLVAESDYGDIRLEIVDYAAGTAGNLTGSR